jgi:hypothetical protein
MTDSNTKLLLLKPSFIQLFSQTKQCQLLLESMDVAMDVDFAAKSLVQIGNLTNAPTQKVMLFAQLITCLQNTLPVVGGQSITWSQMMEFSICKYGRIRLGAA